MHMIKILRSLITKKTPFIPFDSIEYVKETSPFSMRNLNNFSSIQVRIHSLCAFSARRGAGGGGGGRREGE